MKNHLDIGETRIIKHVVREVDLAAFNNMIIHPVYSTFALGRDAEWACRQFVLELKEEDEEGIGTFLDIKHRSPALLNQEVVIIATLKELKGNNVICTYKAWVGERLIAEGEQGQKILKKEKVIQLLSSV